MRQQYSWCKSSNNCGMKAGMKARKWLSNSSEVLAAIPKELRAYEIDLNDSLPAAKTLYVLWRKGPNWNEPIDRELSIRARDWFSELKNLPEINVPRCLQESTLGKSISVQTFVDTSNEAYGGVNYLRSEYAPGCYGARIIGSKTRVGPLTPMSTPRLELMAAILGLHLTLSILAALNIPIAQARFWSDSMNVLYWIRGKGKQYRPFVANRIGEIQRQSNPEQWHVESKENPADLCSRGLGADVWVKVKAHFGGEALIFCQSTRPSGRSSKLQKGRKWKPSIRQNSSQGHRWTS